MAENNFYFEADILGVDAFSTAVESYLPGRTAIIIGRESTHGAMRKKKGDDNVNDNINNTVAKKYVTIVEASRYSGISQHFIRAKVKSGDIPHLMCGMKYLINYEGMIEYLNSCEIAS